MPGILSQTAAVSAAAVGARALSVVRGIALAGFLGPTGYGQLNGLLLIAEYGDKSHLGALNAMARNAPIASGAERHEEAEAITGAALGTTLLTSSLLSIGILLTSLAVRLPADGKLAMALMAPVVFFSQLHLFQNTLARVRLRMHLMGALRIWNAAWQLAFAVGFGFLWGLPGVVGGVALGTMLTVLWGHRRLGGYPMPRIRWSEIGPLLRIGAPLVWITSMYTVLESVGRIAILRWLGPAQLGPFAVGLLAVSVLAFIPSAVGQVLSPRIMRAYGRQESAGVERLLREPIVFLGLLLPVLAATGAVTLPWVVHSFLPRFAAAVLPGQILLLNFTPYALRAFSSEVLVASARLNRIALLQSIGIVLLALLVALSLTFGLGIVGVAASMAAVYWIYGVSMMATALRVRGTASAEIVRFISASLLPTIWAALVCVGLARTAAALDIAVEGLAWALTAAGVVAVASTPLLWLAWRRLAALRSDRRFGNGVARVVSSGSGEAPLEASGSQR